MPRDYLPSSDPAFDLWFSNFVDQVVTRGPALGFSAAEVLSLTNARDEWDVAFAARLSAGAAARAATAAKRDARRVASLLVRPYVRRVQAHADTTDAIRSELRLTLLEDGTNGSNGGGAAAAFDAVPLLLLDFGTRGQIKVHFGPNPANENRNGLPAGAIGAVLQTRAGSAGDEGAWEWLDNPSASPHTHVVQPSAVTTIGYRCAYLFRRGRKGPWSAPAEAAVTP